VSEQWAEGTSPSPVYVFRRPVEVVAADIEHPHRSVLASGLKRLLDLACSAVALVVLAPVFAVIALVLKVTSGGPVMFAQDRIGKGGRRFRFYKFRTMVEGAEARKAELEHLNEMSGPVFKIARDPRVTRVGAWLRKSSLDELPQFWNVLKGDMSLVGPRPPIPDEVERYTKRQAQRLAVTPGLTGLWQVSGRSTISGFDAWVEIDLRYVNEWSLWLDLRILAKTPFVVISTRGAH
jgi:exopolysaccharide biosynthesis polyprenyl glycosylphosphotransferase